MKIASSQGVISSPGYPISYPSNAVCRYEITVPAGQRVKLVFTDLQTEGEHLSLSTPDMLHEYDLKPRRGHSYMHMYVM